MNDEELEKFLRGIPRPLPDESVQGRAWDRARTAFRQPAGAAEQDPRRGNRGWFPLLAGAAAVCLLGLISVWNPLAKPELDLRVVEQLRREFPGRLAAVVQKGDRFDLVLSDQGPASSEPEVLVTIRQGKEEWKIVAFSGSRIDLEGLPSGPIEVLLSEDGKIIVSGPGFAWSGSSGFKRGGWVLNARML